MPGRGVHTLTSANVSLSIEKESVIGARLADAFYTKRRANFLLLDCGERCLCGKSARARPSRAHCASRLNAARAGARARDH